MAKTPQQEEENRKTTLNGDKKHGRNSEIVNKIQIREFEITEPQMKRHRNPRYDRARWKSERLMRWKHIVAHHLIKKMQTLQKWTRRIQIHSIPQSWAKESKENKNTNNHPEKKEKRKNRKNAT